MFNLFYFKRGVFNTRGNVLLESTRGNVCDLSFREVLYITVLDAAGVPT